MHLFVKLFDESPFFGWFTQILSLFLTPALPMFSLEAALVKHDCLKIKKTIVLRFVSLNSCRTMNKPSCCLKSSIFIAPRFLIANIFIGMFLKESAYLLQNFIIFIKLWGDTVLILQYHYQGAIFGLTRGAPTFPFIYTSYLFFKYLPSNISIQFNSAVFRGNWFLLYLGIAKSFW